MVVPPQAPATDPGTPVSGYRLALRHPVTTGATRVVAAFAVLSGALAIVNGRPLWTSVPDAVPAASPGRTSLGWVPWHPVPIVDLTFVVVLAGLTVPAMRLWGSRRALRLAAWGYVGATVAGAGTLLLARYLGDGSAADAGTLVAAGPVGGTAAVIAALYRHRPPQWQLPLRAAVGTLVVLCTVVVRRPADTIWLAATLCGLSIGSRPRSVVAAPLAPAPRPLLAALTGMFGLELLFARGSGRACGSGTYLACQATLTHAAVRHLAAAVTPEVVALALLVLAEGLRRGRRFAWWGALVAYCCLAVTGLHALPFEPAATPSLWALVMALQPVFLMALLCNSRAAFQVRAPAGTYRRLIAAAAVALAVVWAVRSAVATLTASRGPDPATGMLHTGAVTVFLLAVLVVVPATYRRHRAPHHPYDANRARRLLERHGGGVLSFMSTWHGNRYWFTGDGRAAVAYRLVGSVALTVGDPFGERAALPAAVGGFTAFCATNGWTPCLYSISQELADRVASTGWRLLPVAEDARLELPDLRFTGRRWQDVRTAINRARREGIVAEWVTFGEAPPVVTGQIRRVCAAWAADRRTPEMSFTLGGIEELRDAAVRCLIAVDADHRVLAVTSWLPVHADGAIAGWTLDMMRRRPAAGNGVMEFLIASAALQFQREGAQFLSLSGTPLAHTGTRAGNDLSRARRSFESVGRLLEPIYGFRALLAFKAKFQPAYHPLYLAYPCAAALPAIAVAVARAYLPDLTLHRALRLAVAAARHRIRPGPPDHAGAHRAARGDTEETPWVPGRW